MKSELEVLEKLQILDMEILEHRKELNAIPKNLEAMHADVSHVSDLLDREKARLQEAELWRANREKDVLLQNELLSKSRSKLQAARNEKEQKAAQREIDTIKKSIQEREEEALKMMEASEQYRKAIEEHTKEFEELESHLKASEQEAVSRMSSIETVIGGITQKRSALISQVPIKTLRLYERIHARLGRAVVQAVEGHCTGCNMEILPQMYNELQRGDKMFQCANCFRILVYKTDKV